MKAIDTELTKFLGAEAQYYVPIYQRKYSWKNRDAERWVGFLPDFRICPIICFMKTIHNNLNLQKSPNDGKIYK